MGSAVGSVGGGILGAYVGGPAGAAVGSSVGGSLLGGESQANSAQDAAAAQEAAAQAAGQTDRFYGGQAQSLLNQEHQLSQTQLQNGYQTATNQQAPYQAVGLNSLDQLAQLTGTAIPQGGSLNNSYLTQYNQLQQQYAQLADQAAKQNAQWHSMLGDPNDPNSGWQNLDERNSLQASIFAAGDQMKQLQAQMQGVISNAPAGIQQQLQNNYNQTQAYTQASAYGANNTNNLTNPGTLTMPSSAAGQATGTSPLSGFANSAQAQLVGGYDPSKTLAQNFTTQPGYGFQEQQGERAIANQASASGLLGSASMAQSLMNYGQGLANQSYQQYLQNLGNSFTNYQGQLQNQAGMGQTAANNVGSYAMNNASNLATSNAQYGTTGAQNFQTTGSNIANSQLAYGAAKAGGLINAANVNAANNTANAQLGSFAGQPLAQKLFGQTGVLNSSGGTPGNTITGS